MNVDFPRSARAYTHRIGRTARGGANGTALSLVDKENPAELEVLAEVQATQPALPPLEGDSSLENLPVGAEGGGVDTSLPLRAQPAPLAFDLKEVSRSGAWLASFPPSRLTCGPWTLIHSYTQLEGFRYRVEDVRRAVTKIAIKEARLAEIKQELLNSEALKGHFQENPHEFQILRHDKGILPSHRIQEHLKHVPDYLLPEVRGRKIAHHFGD